MVVELSSDLVEEILSWVPSRSLVRLKYTCKHWKSLISEPRFFNKHLSRMRCRDQQFTVFNNVPSSDLLGSTVSCLGIDFDQLNNPALNLQVLKPVTYPRLVVRNMYHCDGLLLFVTSTKLLILNPLLKRARWIKRGCKFDIHMHVYGLGYISNQSSSSSCNDYKMVRFPCGASDGGKYKGTGIEVYEFNSDSRKVIVDQTFVGFLELPESNVCLRGTPYWKGYLNGQTNPTIQSFDFSKERFETLFLPPSSNGSSNWENSFSLGVFRGDKLSLVHKSRLTSKIQLWVMKKYWSKLMNVAIPEFDLFHRYSSFFTDIQLVLSIRDIKSINIYIMGKDGECQSVEYPSMDPSIGGSACYYVPSLLQVPGLFRGEKNKVRFLLKREDF